MSIEDAELGKLTKDHLETHQQVARQKAELEQIGEDLILLGENLRKRPENIRFWEAKLTLKDGRNEDKIVLLDTFNIDRIFNTVNELTQATEREKGLARQIREAGMGYIVDGLESRKPPTPNILGRSS